MSKKAVRSTIKVHDLVGIFVHASAVLRWPPGSVRIVRREEA